MKQPREAPSLRHAAKLGRALLEHASLEVPPQVDVEVGGHIESAADGVVHVSGLRDVGFGDLVELPRGRALIMDLGAEHAVAAVLASNGESPRVGDRVRPCAERLSVTVDERLLGRVVDPLGAAVDGHALAAAGRPMPLERAAPQIFERSHVHTPLYTGVLAIDAMFPIGRGQRELILGDEGTGKTALAVDSMLSQAGGEVVCVYAGIGQRRSETWRISQQLRERHVTHIVVSAPEDSSPALRYLAPYTATAIGEYFRDRGRHSLVVYDDLSAHAAAWRELSLLLGRPPGREAYPGDVFYLHSRLLERSAQLSPALGGGSMTALPICALESGRLTAYIPTNLVSITDGQLVLNSDLFAAGQRPAIDAGLSVSRVGARAQSRLFASFSGPLKLDYSAFLELEAFTRLGTSLEPEAKRRLELGRRVRQLLRAQQGNPLSLLEQLVRLSLAHQPDSLLGISEDDVSVIASRISTVLAAEHPTLATDVLLETVSKPRIDELVNAQLPGAGRG